MSTELSPSNLPQAAARYRAALSPYLSSSEKAVSELLLALADEISAQSPDRGGNSTGAMAATPAGQAESQSLGAEVAALRAEVNALRLDLNSSNQQGRELQALRAEVEGLRQLLNGGPTQSRRRSAPLPGGLAPMHPVEDLLDDAPQIDETVSIDQMQDYINRPRVRPEDIRLTEEEQQQLRRPHRSKINPRADVRAQIRQEPLSRRGIGPALFMLIVIAAFIILLTVF